MLLLLAQRQQKQRFRLGDHCFSPKYPKFLRLLRLLAPR